GLTLHDSPFTLYTLAIAASAAHGGFAPALVATLASLLLGGVALPHVATHTRLLFAMEGLSVALVVSATRARLRRGDARLREAETSIAELTVKGRRARLVEAALRHLEAAAGEHAVIVLDRAGKIAEWCASAERLYGYSAEQMVGGSIASLFADPLADSELWMLLQRSAETGLLRQGAVHCRHNGNHVQVEVEMRPFRDAEVAGFTLTVYDVARRQEWEDYRDAAKRAQAALEQAAEDARQQLTALESLTDPSLNPLEGPAMITELLERLRTTVRADGAALLQPGETGMRVVAARGLLPTAAFAPSAARGLAMSPGRVAFIHNDPAQVQRLSALSWPAGVTSLMVVPVVHNREVWSVIEVVSERPRRASDWDVALVRVVADRLAAVVVRDRDAADRNTSRGAS
ncbi:MAG: PAS domain S-box protein, partial [Bacteroidales bacterium]